MIEVYCCSIDSIRDDQEKKYIQLIPENWHTDILKYRFPMERKFRLLSRLMLLDQLKSSGCTELTHSLQRDAFNKPMIEGWDYFNISYSENFVLFARSEMKFGIDIEKHAPIDFTGISKQFTPIEHEYIMQAPDPLFIFYEIWTKKEALLKAIGTGIVNGLDSYNCIHDRIATENDNWNFYRLPIQTDYSAYVCTGTKIERNQLHIKEFKPEMMF